jgi:ribonuclease HII
MDSPDFRYERRAMRKGHSVCGIDEAGRGPWAGPVVAAAVMLDPKNMPKGLNDSKKLTPAKRDALYGVILASARVGVGIISVRMIDEVNVLQATFRAMQAAVASLDPKPKLALVDGNRPPPLPCEVTTIIGGDAQCLSIAAASIIAKVTRDRLMEELDRRYPGYGFAAHKGYGTAAHHEALVSLGPCPEHRMSFDPMKTMVFNPR